MAADEARARPCCLLVERCWRAAVGGARRYLAVLRGVCVRGWLWCGWGIWRGGRCALWLQAPGFSDDGKAFTDLTFTGTKGFMLVEVEVFAVSGYP